MLEKALGEDYEPERRLGHKAGTAVTKLMYGKDWTVEACTENRVGEEMMSVP